MTKQLMKASDIESMEGLNKSHFLNENAVRVNKSLGDATGLTGFGFHIIEVPTGKLSTEFHQHYFEDECVFVLSGTATAYIGEESFAIGPGDFIAYPKSGAAHTIKNTGATTLKCIVVGERLAHDVADYPNRKKRIYRNADLPWDLVDLEQLENPIGGKKI